MLSNDIQIGNHGGSSPGETSATLIFMSSAFQNDTGSVHVDTGIPFLPMKLKKAVLQVDLVPTLSLLFGTPIPKNSLGVLISDLFSDRRNNIHYYF